MSENAVTIKPEQTPQPDVPQDRFNEIYRKWKEEQEKNTRLTQEATSIQQENSSLRATLNNVGPTPTPQPATELPPQRKEVMTDTEWNEWFTENPSQAIDWKNKKAFEKSNRENEVRQKDQSFLEAQNTSREKLVTKHADMYQRDSKGVVVRTAEGLPLLDLNSEKVQLFNQVVRDNPDLAKLKSGPELAMREMEKIMNDKNIDPKKIHTEGVTEGVQKAQTAAASAQAGYTAESSSGPAASAPQPDGGLSGEEKRIADRMKITYEDYAKQKNVPRRAPRNKVDYT